MNPKYDTLFYDGSCPLCAKEIRTLRRLQRGQLIFADIHEQPEGSPQLPSHEDLLRRLHLMTWTGEWVTGKLLQKRRINPIAIQIALTHQHGHRVPLDMVTGVKPQVITAKHV